MHIRRKLVVGNWKMNGSHAQLTELAAIAAAAREAAGADVGLCPPFTLIAAATTRSGQVMIGAQDLDANESGAHTGSVSAALIKEAGARMVIVGHSERRSGHHESDVDVRAKAETALRHGLITIICVGESQNERDSGGHLGVVERQLSGSLPDRWDDGELVVAYEPVWAIGTGKVAGPGEIGEMHKAIRTALVVRYGDVGNRIRILYGGSVNAGNAAEIFGVADVDGGLVGGASLVADQFVPIIEAASGR